MIIELNEEEREELVRLLTRGEKYVLPTFRFRVRFDGDTGLSHATHKNS